MDPRAAVDPIEAAQVRNEVRERLFGLPPTPVVVGRFTVLERIGRGAMGVVYAAEDRDLERKVAIKLLHADGAERAILVEAKALARLRHPNVVSVYDVGTWANHTFVAMEHVDGQSLASWLTETPRAWPAVLGVFVAAGRGLAAAHAAGLVHRDFKPENVVVGAGEQPRVVDFGLAREVGEVAPASASPAPRAVGGESQTRSRLAGTPAYMAHELFDGKPATAQSDQFAFCVALYRALWGVAPFDAEAPVLGRDGAAAPRRPPRSAVPAHVVAAVLRGLAPSPGDRHPDMDALLAAIEGAPARPWVRRLAIGVAVAAAAAAAVGARWAAAPPALCASAGPRLAEVWNDGERARLAAAFSGSGKPFAPAALRTVESALDAYGAAWTAMYRDSCEATHVRGDQSRELLDLRSTCLERRRSALRGTVAALAAPDDRLVERSVALVEGLPPLATCADVASLTSSTPPPEDPARRARLTELERALDDARTAFVAGKLLPAEEATRALAEEARRLDHRPFSGEVAFLAGSIASARGNQEEAERALGEAVKAGQASGHAELVARAATKLLGVTGTLQMQFEKARVWRDLAEASVERVANRRLAAELDDRVATVLHEEGKYDEALVRVERAVKTLEELGDVETATYAGYLSDWGNILDSRGRLDEALQRLGQSLALREKLTGNDHPEVARTLNNIAVTHSRRDELEKARAAYERAIGIAERVGGMDYHSAFIDNLAGVLVDMGRIDEALAMRMKAHAMREKELPPGHPDMASSWNNLGNIYQHQKRYDEALAAYEKALAIRRAAYGADHPEVASALGNTGEIYEERGDLQGALQRFRGAAEMYARTKGESGSMAWWLSAQGRVEVALRRYDAGIANLQRGIAMFEKEGSYAEELAKARFSLARGMWDSNKDRKGGRALAEKARAGPFTGDVSALTSKIDAWLAVHPSP